MKRDPFQKLRDVPVPPPSDAAREKALHRATLAFRSRPQGGATKSAAPWWSIFQAAGFSLAVFVLMIWLLPSGGQGDASVQRRLLEEMSSIFPESLNAVIESQAGTQIDLTAAGQESRDQPLLIEFFKKGRTVRILSYSGRDVDLSIEGTQVKVEGLLTADGHVIVAGPDFLWAPDAQTEWEGYQIRARAL